MDFLIFFGLIISILGAIYYPRFTRFTGVFLMVVSGSIVYLYFIIYDGSPMWGFEMFGVLAWSALAVIIFLVGLFLLILRPICQWIDVKYAPENLPMIMSEPYKRGQSEARTALAHGTLGWKLCGPSLWHDALFKEILKEEYQVELFIIADDNIPDELDREAKGYNEVMAKAMISRFGEDIISLAEKKAKQRFHEQNNK